ncbi:Transcriptional regulator, xre family protein [Lactobacillus selangorensis]|uniref:LexA repressor n=2 Tax=Lactobacillus selangorensis TaxID=81857 RepID=A0A0R2FMM7_9LACO|nr:Transcriptional regulator, xre family protein [Lactobacillus selangorensis]KRN32608.1 Transcriptional regulator, xre family protein [Lactobacillus selangorensis]
MARVNTKRWEQVLHVIHDSIEHNGYPPTVREIGKAINISSSSTVAGYLSRMLKEGYITKDPTKPRALEITEKGAKLIGIEKKQIPIIGTVAAGVPITAIENVEDYFPVPDDLNFDPSDLFMLHVQGNSMINIGILNGDEIIVKRQHDAENGQIVVAQTEEIEATVKRFYKEDDRIRLHPENDDMDDMYFDSVTILGVVVSLYRPALI